MRSIPAWQLERIVRQLAPEDGALIQRLHEQPAFRRARLRRERREAFLAARRVIAPALNVTAAADVLARALRRDLEGDWKHHRALDNLPAGTVAQARALYRVARATGGRPLAARTVLDEITRETGQDLA